MGNLRAQLKLIFHELARQKEGRIVKPAFQIGLTDDRRSADYGVSLSKVES
jgi:hypothetical protein